VAGRRGRRRKQLLEDIKEKKGYWKLKDEALDFTLRGTNFRRSSGPVVMQTTGWSMIIPIYISFTSMNHLLSSLF